jgi:hypothetical protein
MSTKILVSWANETCQNIKINDSGGSADSTSSYLDVMPEKTVFKLKQMAYRVFCFLITHLKYSRCHWCREGERSLPSLRCLETFLRIHSELQVEMGHPLRKCHHFNDCSLFGEERVSGNLRIAMKRSMKREIICFLLREGNALSLTVLSLLWLCSILYCYFDYLFGYKCEL